MATQHTLQNNPGALPSMAWTSLLNLLIPERSMEKRDTLTVFVLHMLRIYLILRITAVQSKEQYSKDDNLMFTIEPGNGDGLQETHNNNRGAYSKFLKQLHHVGATLSKNILH